MEGGRTPRAVWSALLALALLAPSRGQDKDPPPAPQAPAAPQADPLTYLAAPGKVLLPGSPRVGWRVTQTSRAGQQALVTRWAIVGETADAWRVEHVSPSLQALAGSEELRGAVMGLLVRKQDGMVTRAVVGKAGEAGRSIRISEADQGQPEEAPVVSEESLGVKGGTFRARKEAHPQQGTATWVGLEGALREVVLKVEGPAPYELAQAPEAVEVAGRKLLRVRYTNGMGLDLSEDPIVAAFFPAGGPGRGLWAMRGEGFELAISETGTDAAPTLKWE